jgi:pyruvate formate-lyase/glycerol dehydratase family glycyl radical enzyme
MNERVQKLKNRLQVNTYPICVEKPRLVVESYRQTEGEPMVVRNAKAFANYLDHRTIFIEDDELIVGNVASKPMGLEGGTRGPTWPHEDMEDLRSGGYEISLEDESKLRSLDEYWVGKGRTLFERMGHYFDDDRLWPFIQSGILLPPWASKEAGKGHGSAGAGWGLGIGTTLILVDYTKVLYGGLNVLIKEAEEELKNLRYINAGAVKKADFLRAVIIADSAIVRIAQRFGDLAADMATKENSQVRKKELERIAETCRRVPGEPARTFYEAMQSFWFIWLVLATGTAPGGRFDQFMHPFYKKDKKEGWITDEDVLELLELLRIKTMQVNSVWGGKIAREKWAGAARWHNFMVGGVTPEGEDATNELSYLLLEAARDCQVPQHTLTVRVHENTPEALMLKAFEVVKTGIGMPAFIGDNSYIGYFTGNGVSLADARDYALTGCLDGNIPGKSRTSAIGMFVVPRVLEIAMNNGFDPRLKIQLGPKTGEFENFESYKDFLNAFKEQLAYFMGLAAEEHNIMLEEQTEVFPDPVYSSLMYDAIKVGRDALDRTMPFENSAVLNPVGVMNVVDSLAAVKKLVFEEKKVSKKDLKDALDTNWQGNGYPEMRKMFLAAPKYGNGNEYVDSIARDIYRFWADVTMTMPTAWGGMMKPSGISITSHGPGGAITGATPDGRYAGENLADGTMSACQGKDMNGPTALIRSAMAIDQVPYQATLLNMKFHPSALKTTEDIRKLSMLVKTYFSAGGKHIQFNVVDKKTLTEAQENPNEHRDLIVRVAGYSAYFVQLTKAIQNDIVARTQLDMAE